MPKVDDGSTGNKSISNSQKAKGAKAARAAKLGLVKKHGGVCSSCGQTSTSCTPGTTHQGCAGYFQGSFGLAALDLLAEKGQFRMTADGSIISRPIDGTWIDRDVLATRLYVNLSRQVHIVVLYTEVPVAPIDGVPTVATKVDGVRFENGLGEMLTWLDGKWTPYVPIVESLDADVQEMLDTAEDEPAGEESRAA